MTSYNYDCRDTCSRFQIQKKFPVYFQSWSLFISICLVNISNRMALHLCKSNSLLFLLIPQDMPLLPPLAVTMMGGALCPITQTKNPVLVSASLASSSSHPLTIFPLIYSFTHSITNSIVWIHITDKCKMLEKQIWARQFLFQGAQNLGQETECYDWFPLCVSFFINVFKANMWSCLIRGTTKASCRQSMRF